MAEHKLNLLAALESLAVNNKAHKQNEAKVSKNIKVAEAHARKLQVACAGEAARTAKQWEIARRDLQNAQMSC